MLSIQVTISFLLWLGSGYWMWRSGTAAQISGRMPGIWRLIAAPLILFGSALFLFLALLLLERAKAIEGGTLKTWGWVATTIGGAAFVCLQVAAIECLLANMKQNVTDRQVPTSDPKEGNSE